MSRQREKAVGIDALLKETRVFRVPAALGRRANVSDPRLYGRAARDPEAFWAKLAKELMWFRPFRKTLVRRPPPGAASTLLNRGSCLRRHEAQS